MNKIYQVVFGSLFLILSACGSNPGESNTSSEAVDSVTTDSVAVTQPEEALSGKAALITKVWKAEEVVTPTAKLPGDFIDIKFTFHPDKTFDYSEDGKKQKGVWTLNSEETMLMFEYEDGRKADHDIKELNENKLVISGKEHGMYRTLVLVAKG